MYFIKLKQKRLIYIELHIGNSLKYQKHLPLNHKNLSKQLKITQI